MDYFLQLFLSGICIGAVYGLGAIGFVIIYKSSGIFNLAHGEMMMVGAFFGVTFANLLGWPMWLAFILALVLAAVTGFVIQFLVIRPLTGQSHFAVLMVTVGLMFIIKGGTLLVWGHETYDFRELLFQVESLEIGEAIIASEYIVGFIVSIVLFVLLWAYFSYTKNGLSMRATADDEELAESMGVRVRRIFGMSWILAGVSSAVGGIIMGMMTTIDYNMGEVGLKVLPVVVFGGLESFLGAIVGGIVVGVTGTLSGGYLDEYLTGFKEITPYILMLLVLLIKPFGLFGEKKIERI
ncbi:MAG: branched-chain amino acid ABC transporter permease [Proteobacteria bacterium]|nr:branched-chain amino acid ABC transporter permease [Pseudomonadota bacterium]